MKVLVTGCAGFIGSHVTDLLLEEGYEVIGLDNFNNYYDPQIKEKNIKNALKKKKFTLTRIDILDLTSLERLFKINEIDVVVHLAARAGVRPSLTDPLLYATVNKLGTANLLKLSTKYKVKKFILCSSSSVYGNEVEIPFKENQTGNVISPYAASKKAAEILAETFYKLHGMRTVILRLFTVYGPRGRPDMAPAIFTKKILNDEEIIIFGDGSSLRDYTYVGDIAYGILLAVKSKVDFEIINLGNSAPVKLIDFVKTIERHIGKEARIKKSSSQSGDMEKTWADITKAKNILKWNPKTKLSQGIYNYISWIKN